MHLICHNERRSFPASDGRRNFIALNLSARRTFRKRNFMHHRSTNIRTSELTRVSPFVYLKILASGENLPAPRKRARERLFSRMHPDVVHQFILGLKRPSIPRTVLPKTRVRRTLRSSDVFHRQMRNYLVHAGEVLPAGLSRRRLFRVYPQALHLLLDGLPHVPEEGPVDVRGVVRHAHVRIQILMVVGLGMVGGVVVRAGIQHLMMGSQMGMLVRSHLAVMVEEDWVAGSGLGRREVVVVPSEKEIARRVSRMRIQMTHVPIVGLEMMILGAGSHLRRRHRCRRVLVRRRYRRGTSVVAGTHLQPVRRQVVVPTVHESVYHLVQLVKSPIRCHLIHLNTTPPALSLRIRTRF